MLPQLLFAALALGSPLQAQMYLVPANCAVPKLQAEMLARFDAGRSIEDVMVRAYLCFDEARSLEERARSGYVIGVSYYQELEALLHDAKYARYLQAGRPPDMTLETFAASVRVARGELAQKPYAQADTGPAAAKYGQSRRTAAETIEDLRVRLSLVRKMEADQKFNAGQPVRFGRNELAGMLQGPSFRLAALEAEAHRADSSVQVSRVGATEENYVGLRPVTTQLMSWAQIHDFADGKAAATLADNLGRLAAERLGEVHSCYAKFKDALDVVVPDVRAVAPVGGADDWYRTFNFNPAHLGFMRLRRIDPMTVPWTQSGSLENSGLLGLILNYDADCKDNQFSVQTALSGHIEAITRDDAGADGGGARTTFNVCAEGCRKVNTAFLESISAQRNPWGGQCLNVYAFVSDSAVIARPKQPAADVPVGISGTDFAARAEVRRQQREREARLRANLEKGVLFEPQ